MDRSDNAAALSARDVRRRFDRAAERFDDADFVHGASRQGLLDRLDPVVVDASTVIDLGSATGTATRPLARRFRGARIVSVDLSHNMLAAAARKRRWLARNSAMQANAEQLPLADHSVDVVFSNMLLPWISDPPKLFAEVARVLRQGGLFGFATLGPDSLQQLRQAWQQADQTSFHVNDFADMHNIGDGLLHAGLRDPVLDVDRIAVSYSSPDDLFRDLTAAGARNSLVDRHPGLVGRHKFERMRQALGAGQIHVDLEIVYGHCWGSGRSPDDGEYRISAGQIPLRKR